MAANLYAKSIFGEDALANLSIEKPADSGPEAPVTGHIRIRAKSQVRTMQYKGQWFQWVRCGYVGHGSELGRQDQFITENSEVIDC